MYRGIFIGICFLLTFIGEAAFFHALPYPLYQIPLTLLIGILLLHTRIEEGILWVLLAIIFSLFGLLNESPLALVIAGSAGVLLVRYFFSRRSVFGLLALGFCVITLYLVVSYFREFHATASLLVLSEVSLFLLFSISQYTRNLFGSFLRIRGI